jgi:hypothetical protein
MVLANFFLLGVLVPWVHNAQQVFALLSKTNAMVSSKVTGALVLLNAVSIFIEANQLK